MSGYHVLVYNPSLFIILLQSSEALMRPLRQSLDRTLIRRLIMVFLDGAVVLALVSFPFYALAGEAFQGPAHPFTIHISAPNPAPGAPVVSADDADVAQGAANDLQILKNAIAKAVKVHASVLRLSPRIYNVSFPTGASTTAFIVIASANDLTIDGAGASLVFHGLPTRAGLLISQSHRLQIKNLTVYWADRLEFPATFSNVGERHVLTLSPSYSIDPRNPPKITTIFQYDIRKNRYLVSHTQHFDHKIGCASGIVSCANYTGGTTFLINGLNDFSSIPDNSPMVATVRANGVSAIEVTNASGDISLDHFTLYNSPGAGFVAINAGSGFRLSNVKITRMPIGVLSMPPALMSTASDALDFIATEGNILIEDSEVAYQGDDGVNIRGETTRVTNWRGSGLPFRVELGYAEAINIGDHVDLVDGDTFQTIQSGTITESKFDGQGFLVSMTGEAKVTAASIYFVDHRLDSAGFVIQRNKFHDNKNRGILLRGHDGLVSSNEIFGTASSAVQIAAEIQNGHAEGPPPSNISIINNKIWDVNQSDYMFGPGEQKFPGAIVTYVTNGKRYIDAPLIHDILIWHNTIYNLPGEAISLFSGGLVSLKKNTIMQVNQFSFNWAHDYQKPVYSSSEARK